MRKRDLWWLLGVAGGVGLVTLGNTGRPLAVAVASLANCLGYYLFGRTFDDET